MKPDTTPEPVYDAPNTLHVEPGQAVRAMDYPTKARFRLAASRIKTAITEQLGPDAAPIGELIARELLTIEEFGWSLGAQSQGTRLLRAVESIVPPPDVPAQSSVRGEYTIRGGFIVPKATNTDTASETR